MVGEKVRSLLFLTCAFSNWPISLLIRVFFFLKKTTLSLSSLRSFICIQIICVITSSSLVGSHNTIYDSPVVQDVNSTFCSVQFFFSWQRNYFGYGSIFSEDQTFLVSHGYCTVPDKLMWTGIFIAVSWVFMPLLAIIYSSNRLMLVSYIKYSNDLIEH